MYRALFTLVGLAAIALGVLLLVAPHLYLDLYTDLSDEATFAARRLSPAVIGLGAILLATSTLPKGALAARIATIGALVWFGVAATGMFHYATGVAQANILIAAGTELLLGLLFALAARTHRAP